MPSFRQRLANVLLRPEAKALNEAATVFLDAYERGPAAFPVEMFLSRLGEIDSQYIDLILRQLQNQQILVSYTSSEDTRLRTVWHSRQLYDTDAIVEASVDMWTDFGFGLNIEVNPRDENAKIVWDEFWLSPANSYLLSTQAIHDLSKDLLVDGDFLLLFFTNVMTGVTTLRKIKTEKIKGGMEGDGIIGLPDDAQTPVLYCRNMSNVRNAETEEVYYIDWRATDEMVRQVVSANDLESPVINITNGTKVRAMLVAHRPRVRRGWPLMTTGFSWVSTYSTFLQDRASVARAVAMYVDKLIAKGGQRAIDTIKQRLESSLATGDVYDTNPRPTGGSTWIENEALTRERMPMGTGASDAMNDGAMLKAQVGLSARIYNHWLGSGESYRLATATSMETPVQRAFNRYQLFWSDVWQNIAYYVLTQAELYGKQNFKTKVVDASSDALISIDMNSLKAAVDGFISMSDRTLLDPLVSIQAAEALLKIILQSVGVSDIQDLLDKEKVDEPPPGDEDKPAPAPDNSDNGDQPEEKDLTAREIIAWLSQPHLS